MTRTKLVYALDELQSQGFLRSYEITEQLKIQLSENLFVSIPKGSEDIALKSFKENFVEG